MKQFQPNRFSFVPINLNINTGSRGTIKIKSGCLFPVQCLSFSFLLSILGKRLYSACTAGNSAVRSPLSLTLYNSEFTSQATMGKGSRDQTAHKAVLLVLVCMLPAWLCAYLHSCIYGGVVGQLCVYVCEFPLLGP